MSGTTLVTQVKKLRKETGLPLMVCRRALQQSNFNYERAKQQLREDALARAKKQGFVMDG